MFAFFKAINKHLIENSKRGKLNDQIFKLSNSVLIMFNFDKIYGHNTHKIVNLHEMLPIVFSQKFEIKAN